HNRPQSTSTGLPLERLARNGRQGSFRKTQMDTLQIKEFLVLADQGVFRFPQDTHERLLIQLLKGRDDREAPDELRNHAKFQEIFGLDLGQQGTGAAICSTLHFRAESQTLATDTT